MKKRVLVLVFSNLKQDARVLRQVLFLKKEYDVTVACFGSNKIENVVVYEIQPTTLTIYRKILTGIFLVFRLFPVAYRLLHNYEQHIHVLRSSNFDMVVANDAETLPIAFSIVKGKGKVFFDAHEYAPRQFEDRLYWRLFFKRFNTWLCTKYIHKVAGMSTIGRGISDEYTKNFGVEALVITNAPNYQDLQWNQVEKDKIKLVHHGIFNISRQPELMLDMMELTDKRFTLDLILVLPESSSRKTKQFFEEFKKRASKNTNVKVLPSLKTSEIVSTLNRQYDLGLILIPPVNYNYENGMPNKLFDFIQARVGLAIGPLKEMTHICTEYRLGIVSPDFTAKSMAEMLNALSLDDVNQYKENSVRAARELCAEHNEKLFLEKVRSIFQESTL